MVSRQNYGRDSSVLGLWIVYEGMGEVWPQVAQQCFQLHCGKERGRGRRNVTEPLYSIILIPDRGLDTAHSGKNSQV
jgi:hypothetical protein